MEMRSLTFTNLVNSSVSFYLYFDVFQLLGIDLFKFKDKFLLWNIF
jgi:hypothetical protein